LRALVEKKPDTPIARRAALMLAGSYHAEGAYGPAATELDQYLSAYPKAENLDAVRLFDGMCHFQAGENDLAKEVLRDVASTSSLHKASADLTMEMERYLDIPRKSPLVAGVLSALLPGAGQVYVGRRQDAVLAFILNGVLTWAAYESFDNGENVTGAVLSAVEAGWYFGNIYNAMNNAHKFNRRERERFFENLEVRFGPLWAPAGGAPGAAGGVGFRF
jgi:TM2 domain-containing membrane protein YozV